MSFKTKKPKVITVDIKLEEPVVSARHLRLQPSRLSEEVRDCEQVTVFAFARHDGSVCAAEVEYIGGSRNKSCSHGGVGCRHVGAR